MHEYRHYKKLTPRLPYHRKRLDAFKEQFWKLYRRLLAYRDHPSQQEADDLQAEFERLFGQSSGYQQLDERKALTLAKKEALLMVLSHPEMLLHNHPAERGGQAARPQTGGEPPSTHSGGNRGLGYLSDPG